jgi:hypothetical protein
LIESESGVCTLLSGCVRTWLFECAGSCAVAAGSLAHTLISHAAAAAVCCCTCCCCCCCHREGEEVEVLLLVEDGMQVGVRALHRHAADHSTSLADSRWMWLGGAWQRRVPVRQAMQPWEEPLCLLMHAVWGCWLPVTGGGRGRARFGGDRGQKQQYSQPPQQQQQQRQGFGQQQQRGQQQQQFGAAAAAAAPQAPAAAAGNSPSILSRLSSALGFSGSGKPPGPQQQQQGVAAAVGG